MYDMFLKNARRLTRLSVHQFSTPAVLINQPGSTLQAALLHVPLTTAQGPYTMSCCKRLHMGLPLNLFLPASPISSVSNSSCAYGIEWRELATCLISARWQHAVSASASLRCVLCFFQAAQALGTKP
jgi:hypothetical protein